VRVLVTNDDGVHAPGLAAITRALGRWAAQAPPGEDRDVVVVAPLANHSGASAAVGTVYERQSIAYQRVTIEGAETVPTYGVDAPPALAVLVGTLGGFGPRADIVVSGINLGVNVGRSVLYSGTVGATLSGAQLGLRGLAVSLRSGRPPEHWETAADIAVSILPTLCDAPPRTVLNLNVPSLPDEGEVRLILGTAIPSLGEVGPTEDPEDDAALIAAGFASITPIVGVREDISPDSDEIVRAALTRMHRLLGR
jgi:5'-nucleotidase